ncbi:ZP domain-containing protein-like [Oculina patagonica]
MKKVLIFVLSLLVIFNLSSAQESPTNATGGAEGEMVIDSAAKLGIVCNANYIEVTVESKDYPGLDTNITHLEDKACPPTYIDESKAVFKFGLEECKTKQEDDGKVIHYKNRIIAVVDDVDEEEHITRKSTRVLPFECSFKKKVVLSKVSYSPGYTQLITNAEDYGNFTYTMDMYTNENHSEKVEKYPLLVGISQRLYINLQVQSGDTGLNLFPDECKATPSTDYDAETDHLIIEEACPIDKYLEYEYKKSATQSFSFLAFRFKSGYQDVYIHCKLTVCRSDDQESKCEKGCQEDENDSRKKRDITEGYSADLYVGPIKIQEEQENAMESADSSEIAKDSPKALLLVGVLVGLLGTITLGLIGALIIMTRRRRHSANGPSLLVHDE